MRILVFQNHPCEDAAGAGEAFVKLGHSLHVIACYNNGPAPAMSDGDALLVLGGPMNVYEEDKHPFLRWETDFIRRWTLANRPFLGLCLGAQLLSKAMGGRVTPNATKEIGHYLVELTAAGKRDVLFDGFPDRFSVVQWHGDTFTIPPGGTHLARTTTCENQALRINRAIGLQFHLEIDRNKMNQWVQEYVTEPNRSDMDIQRMLADFKQYESAYAQDCHRLVENFCKIANVTPG